MDLNPHQVRAALFALQSPLSKGVIFADEVGLGKTIEAGLVIAQKWAERKRKILLITPAFLRKQWEGELKEKFCLPCRIIDSKNWNGGVFGSEEILICSYPFAASKADQLKRDWDLVVIDKAHRMRNVYKTSNKHSRVIAEVFKEHYKLLLTATPLQNNLMELFGLISVIDPYVFGDEVTFRDQFARDTEERNESLRKRTEPLVIRTLRKHVQEYIAFTNRVAITQNFIPNDDEQVLYESVSAYLQRKDLSALPNGQRQLITLVLRRILASSSFAITQINVMGSVDDLWINKDGEIIVVDYKATSKKDEVTIDADWQGSYKRQMEIYQWLLRRNGFKVSDTGYFVYCNGKKNVEGFNGRLEFDISVIPYKGSDDWIEPKLQEIYACLLLNAVPESSSTCDLCQYRLSVSQILASNSL